MPESVVPPPLTSKDLALQALVDSLSKKIKHVGPAPKFVKRAEVKPVVELPSTTFGKKMIALSERGLVG